MVTVGVKSRSSRLRSVQGIGRVHPGTTWSSSRSIRLPRTRTRGLAVRHTDYRLRSHRVGSGRLGSDLVGVAGGVGGPVSPVEGGDRVGMSEKGRLEKKFPSVGNLTQVGL